ncbi:MAG TPA: biotin/lipoyl-binding protein [Vicinamibacterales bacterium]|jgi:multidrug resistance efflux pump
MEIILLGIYAFFVWLIFIKFKLLPWTTPWKVGVVILPVVGLGATMLALNVFAPTTTDVRVVKYVVPIVAQVKGRVIEVPVANNQPVKKGDVLFRIDPTPYESEVRALEAQLISEEAKVGAERARFGETETRLPDAEATERQLREQLNQATNQIASLQASLELARRRVAQNTELAATGAGNRFDLEQAQTNVSELTAQIAAARAAEQEVREKLSGRIRGDFAAIAGVRAQMTTAQAQIRVAQAQADTTRAKLENARWNLEQTTVVAPGNGTMVNVMLRPGYFVTGVAFNEVMTFVDTEYQIFALYNQNELHQVESGNEAEITLDTYPGRIIKAHVDSVIWAQAQGQIDASGNLPMTTIAAPPGRFPVKLVVAEKDHGVFLAAGARGAAAIYTEHLSLIHLIRKVLLRTASYLDYLIIKHHISLH